MTTTATTNSTIGDYTITAALGTLVSTNYSFAFTNGLLTVNQAAMTITANATNRVYGAVNPVFTGTVVGVVNNDNITGLYSTAATVTSPIGTYTIVPSLSDPDGKRGNYSVTTNAALMTITKAALTVTADDKGRIYGETNPVFTASYTGWLNGDGLAVLSGAPSLTTVAVTNSPIGNYTITAAIGTLSATNYSFLFTNGTLSIGRAVLTVSADAKSRIYGGTNPVFTASYSGWLNGDTTAVLSGAPSLTTTAATNSTIGDYTITAALGTLVSTNYSFAFTNGLLTVNPAAMTITANATNRVYGAANPVFTGTVVGVVNNDNITGLYSTVATVTSPVGNYSILPTLSDPDGKRGNYSITTNSALMTITRAVLTVGADNKSRIYGDANPVFTASYSGWLNADSVAVLAGIPSLTTTATTNSPIGNYTITAAVGTLSATNYSFAFTNGVLTVNQALLAITAHATNRVYGAANPVFTGTVVGVVNRDNITGLYSTVATVTSPIGTYSIVPSLSDPDGKLGNYSVTTNSALLTITRAVLTVTADNKGRIYGETNPVFTASYSGWQNTDSLAILAGEPTLTTPATTNSPVGGYTITAAVGSLGATNYSFSMVDGVLTVSKATLTVTADNKSRIYGDTNPVFTASYSGWKNLDTTGVLSGQPSLTTVATPTTTVGTHVITAALGTLAATNYSFSFVAGTLTVDKSTLTVTADNKSRLFGETNPVFTASYSGWKNTDGLGNVSGAPDLTTDADVRSQVGTYVIDAQLGSLTATNYSFVMSNGFLSIGRTTISVIADNKARIYGSTNPVLTASYEGFVDGDDQNIVHGLPTLSTIAGTNSAIGDYTIVVSQGTLVATNYSFSFTNGTLTVNKAAMSITADATNRVYGETNPVFTGTVVGVVNNDNITGLYSTAATPASPVGTYDIVPSLSDPNNKFSNYTVTTNRALMTITKAMLTASADDQTRYYGRVNPALTISYSGWLNGDTPSLFTTMPTCTTPGVQSSLVGTYPITAAGGVSSNYNFTYYPATLTVTKAPLLVVGDDTSRYYGRTNPVFSAVVTGVTNNDNITVEFDTAATNTSPAGRYKIFLLMNDTAGRLGQYAVTLRSAVLTVEPGPLVGTVSSESRPYAGTNSPFSVTYSGWQNGEGTNLLEGTLDYACTNNLGETVDSTTSVGSYPIRVVTEQTATNYAVSYVDGTLTVTQVALTVTGNDATRVYGDANPDLTGMVTGQVNNDTITATFRTTAQPGSAVGTYNISPVWNDPGTKLGNYTITTNLGTLTVTKAPLSVIVDNKSRTYGAGNPALTGTLTGVVNSDNITPSYSTLVTVLSAAGSYDILASLIDPDSKLGNYSLTNTSGTLTITKAALVVAADDKSKTYGSSNPTLTASYAGFVNSENATSLGGTLSLATDATASSPTGTYTITPSGYTSGNYDISYTNGTLTVGSATLTVSGDDKSRVYGAANPTLTGTLVGVVSGDSITAAWSTTATNNSVVGTYAISPVWTDPDGKLGNYIITTNLGTLSITKAALTVTADDQSRSYGDANPALTISYSGFVAGDTAASLTTQPTCSVSATLTTIPGTYAITPSGATSPNYTISHVDGTLTVGKALLVIIGDDATKNYGKTNPVFTASIVGIKNGDNLTFDYFTEATQFSLPGKYYIEILIGDGDGKLANYEVVMTGGRLTIKPAVLTGTIASQSRGYGQNNSPFSAVYTGFVYPTDTNLLRGTLTLTSKTAGGANVTSATAPGSYAIKATGKQTLTNYTVTYVDGALTITQAVLTVTGNNATRAYGSANPTLTANTTGFVNSETASVLGGSLSVTTPATVTSPSGSYAVSPGGYTSVNYAIHYVDGALTVTKAPLAGEITAATRAYGQNNPTYAVTYTGFLNGDTTNVLGS
ncbi:MAG: MBG domain-containing protein [Verrucomicrobia bacterium]|nr:MBG domain-containing protein [Verrucomicrobiota bacterium]